MPIPSFHEILLPLLRRCIDGDEWTVRALRVPIADDFGLTDAEPQGRLPVNLQVRFASRLSWSKIYPERAGLIDRVRRSMFTPSVDARGFIPQPASAASRKALRVHSDPPIRFSYPQFCLFSLPLQHD